MAALFLVCSQKDGQIGIAGEHKKWDDRAQTKSWKCRSSPGTAVVWKETSGEIRRTSLAQAMSGKHQWQGASQGGAPGPTFSGRTIALSCTQQRRNQDVIAPMRYTSAASILCQSPMFCVTKLSGCLEI